MLALATAMAIGGPVQFGGWKEPKRYEMKKDDAMRFARAEAKREKRRLRNLRNVAAGGYSHD